MAAWMARLTLVFVALVTLQGSTKASITMSYLGHAYYDPPGAAPKRAAFGGDDVIVSLYNDKATLKTRAVLSEGGAFAWSANAAANGLASAPPGLTNSSGTQADIVTFCIQLNQNLASTTYTLTPLELAPIPNLSSISGGGLDADGSMKTDTVQVIEWLWTEHIVDALSSADGAAAFQLAIWKLEYDGRNTGTINWSTTAPKTPTTPANHIVASGPSNIIDLATLWIHQASAHDPIVGTPNYAELGLVHLAALTSENQQDQLTPYIDGVNPFITVPVPEPVSLIVWSFLGLAGVAFGRRRKLG